MNKLKRKPFFIKRNFHIAFVIGFILLLLLEVMLAGALIYKLSAEAIENAAFSSHININRSAQLIKPIILKVNIYVMLMSVLLAGLAIAITYFRLHFLFSKIIRGLENFRNNNTPFHIKPSGGKQTRELIKEFNHASSCLDNRLSDLRLTLDSLLVEKDLKQTVKLQNRLYSIISHKNNK